MEFRDLKLQYRKLKPEIDEAVNQVISKANFISGYQVEKLEETLANYVGVKHCISCANGTDALKLALMAWNIGEGDAVFVPDFTFFASGEVVADLGATPVFVDVNENTFNISIDDLEASIKNVINEGILTPKVIITVDLFGLPADYPAIRKIADKYNLLILEDGAQGFGGAIRVEGKWNRACSFGDISTTSFFPAKPLGCYGDGGAIFTDNTEWANLIKSFRIHGKGSSKYDNIRIGMNSRLDTIQAAILLVKFKAFTNYELDDINKSANKYNRLLEGIVEIPFIDSSFYSSWAQYTIKLRNRAIRDDLQAVLKSNNIPSMVYYSKPMHEQKAFIEKYKCYYGCPVSIELSTRVLSLPIHPYIEESEVDYVADIISKYIN